MQTATTSQIEAALEELKKGNPVIVTDDENRENEGDLIIPAETATPETIGFMVRHTSGILCLSMLESRLNELQIPQMVEKNSDPKKTAFTISVDARYGTSTGVSAKDRTKTIKTLIDPCAEPQDLTRPGHVFPLRYQEGGVLKRSGHTEAAVDLCKLAGLYPAGVLGEIVNDDGTMSRRAELEVFAKKHNLLIITIADLIRYRHKNEKLVTKVSEARIPTEFGDFTAVVYESTLDNIQHIALVKGNPQNKENVMVRVHSECLTGDVFGSKRCDCGTQLNLSLKRIAEEGEGILVYLRGHEGRGIGLGHKLRAYTLQDQGCDTVEANLELGLPVDSREYGIGAQMLSDLGVTTLRLLTNNPAKYSGLAGYNLTITERISIQGCSNKDNYQYLKTKQDKLGHLLNLKNS